MLSKEVITSQLTQTLGRTQLHELGLRYEGKVRDNYTKGDTRYLVATDRISAFDKVLGTIPLKGQILNQMAAWWFEQTKDICPNHVIDIPDPQVTVAKNLNPVPMEVIVRAYLTGVTSTSIWTHYSQGKRVYAGHTLPDGMRKHQRLEKPIITPSTKAEQGEHDETISREQALARGLVTEAEFDHIAEKAMALFNKGTEIAQKRGLILVDTKYEFGKDEAGNIFLMDEIHTPDSSRYWYSRTYDDRMKQGGDPDALDKEFVRRYLVSLGYKGEGEPPTLPDDIRVEAAARYAQTFELLTGREFAPDLGNPLTRIRQRLGLDGARCKAKIFITPRAGVLDPQGDTVSQALHRLGFTETRSTRIGKYIELILEETDKGRAMTRATEMCQQLLANPIIEDFRIEIE
jgi:phosphoribosylaminoimidazole-succinocarboxamide synthase